MATTDTTKKEAHPVHAAKPATAVKAPAVKRSRKAKVEGALPHLRIRVRAYEHGVLDKSVKQIIDTAARYSAKVIGPVPLPIDIKKYTVNRAAFIDKDSREQFELRVHKRLVEIMNPTQKMIESLSNLNLPAGVDIEIKMV